MKFERISDEQIAFCMNTILNIRKLRTDTEINQLLRVFHLN